MEGWMIHASDEYRRGVPLIQLKAGSPDVERKYQAEAARMNREGRACRAGFVLAASS
jgi:hypothetical protein